MTDVLSGSIEIALGQRVVWRLRQQGFERVPESRSIAGRSVNQVGLRRSLSGAVHSTAEDCAEGGLQWDP